MRETTGRQINSERVTEIPRERETDRDKSHVIYQFTTSVHHKCNTPSSSYVRHAQCATTFDIK